jgi:hypothetical protein
MTNYDPNHLKQIQQYRAVIEPIPSSKGGFIDREVISLPEEDLDALVALAHPTRDSPTDASSRVTELHNGFRKARTAVIESRLSRIANQDTTEPFEAVTSAEVAYGFSDQTLTDARLVNPTGVGVAYSTLLGLLEEMEIDPETALPDGFASSPIATPNGEPLAPSGAQALEDYFEHGPISDDDSNDESSERLRDPTDQLTAKDLADQHSGTTDSLRHQLKYVRDCAFLRSLYEPLTSLLDSCKCPKLVWKQAAIDVKNEQDPFSSDSTDESISTEDLFNPNHLPEHLQSGDNSTESTDAQTGLGQF